MDFVIANEITHYPDKIDKSCVITSDTYIPFITYNKRLAVKINHNTYLIPKKVICKDFVYLNDKEIDAVPHNLTKVRKVELKNNSDETIFMIYVAEE